MKFEGLDDNWNFLNPLGWPKLKKRINKQLERADKLIAKAKSEELKTIEKAKSEELRSVAKVKSGQLTSTNNSRKLPGNATIRKEYVRCGKVHCPCKHGPYYYAYWRNDSGNLKKKYIGKYPPTLENTSKDDESSAFKVTVNDPSHTSEGVE